MRGYRGMHGLTGVLLALGAAGIASLPRVVVSDRSVGPQPERADPPADDPRQHSRQHQRWLARQQEKARRAAEVRRVKSGGRR